jgi:hypothetical protein
MSDIGEVDGASKISAITLASRPRGHNSTSAGADTTFFLCHLCQEPNLIVKCYKGCHFCTLCWAGVRSKHRQLRVDDAAAVENDNILMIGSPEEWRQDSHDFANPETRTRARKNLKVGKTVRSNATATVVSDKAVDAGIGLTKKRYISYMRLWEGTDEDEAADEWDDLCAMQASSSKKRKNKAGQTIVWIEDNPRAEQARSTERRHTEEFVETEDVDEGDVTAKRHRMSSEGAVDASSRAFFQPPAVPSTRTYSPPPTRDGSECGRRHSVDPDARSDASGGASSHRSLANNHGPV